jgi:hypothetical protein
LWYRIAGNSIAALLCETPAANDHHGRVSVERSRVLDLLSLTKGVFLGERAATLVWIRRKIDPLCMHHKPVTMHELTAACLAVLLAMP